MRYTKARRRELLALFALAPREREPYILAHHNLSLFEIRAWALELVREQAAR